MKYLGSTLSDEIFESRSVASQNLTAENGTKNDDAFALKLRTDRSPLGLLGYCILRLSNVPSHCISLRGLVLFFSGEAPRLDRWFEIGSVTDGLLIALEITILVVHPWVLTWLLGLIVGMLGQIHQRRKETA